ncbi:MAG: hypothetical protein IPN75_19305 [Dechloromonas sp.]|uniref:Uncharacterized protein n=1 Tax=Candidatus Dechloromonas phosphorivorans TaxID=2899244 RepID=A0A9D7LW89_9RHOO|nr:hypothetical protein [Candidatus Dechloromonas phosphorivorans]
MVTVLAIPLVPLRPVPSGVRRGSSSEVPGEMRAKVIRAMSVVGGLRSTIVKAV